MLRLGVTNDIDLAPLFFPVEAGWAATPTGLVTKNGTPAELEARLLNGELDIAPINPLTYAKNQAKLLLLPYPIRAFDLSSDAIFLVSNKRLDKYEKPKVAVSPGSGLGEAILRIIGPSFYSIEPHFLLVPGEVAALDALRGAADICILSGETGMRAVGPAKAKGYYVEDLTKAWWLQFELPIPLILFGVRIGWTEQEPGAVVLARATMQMFRTTLKNARDQMPILVEKAEKRTGLPAQVLTNHFSQQRYEFNQNHLRGLLDFYRRLALIQAAPVVADLKFFPILDPTPPGHNSPLHPVTQDQRPKEALEDRPRPPAQGDYKGGREKAEAQGFRVIKGGKDPNSEDENNEDEKEEE